MSGREIAGTCRWLRLGIYVLAFGWALPASAAWTTVGTGIEYQPFTFAAPDPKNRLFVSRMDRHNPQVILDTSIGNGKLSCCPERTTAQASRYDDALGYWGFDWGQRNDVIVAVNGDFWSPSTGIPTNGQIQAGWYVKEIFPNYHFFYNQDRRAFLGQAATAVWQVSYPGTGASQSVDGVNQVRGTNELIVYTHQYNTTTLTDGTGTEVVVEVARPNMAAPSSDPTTGRVIQVRQNLGSTTVQFDQIVLSATGTKAATLLANATVGAQVNIVNFLDSYQSVSRSYSAVGGGEVFLVNGIVVGGQAILHPRTAIAYNDDYIFFVVCNGRLTDGGYSVGMNMEQLGNFCKDYLGATWGMNLDGGGSSTMVVNGAIKNNPTDGSERSVSNGVMMVVLQPKSQATTFNSGDVVRTTVSSNVRLGPGTHFPSLATLAANSQATVVDHSLRGIYAKGFNWWKCDFGSTIGWVAGTNLSLVTAGGRPVLTQNPASQIVCPATSVNFTIAASGAAPLSYRWQRNGLDLNDGSIVAGSATTTLTLSNVDETDQASYRCRVSNGSGQATSYSAGLMLRSATLVTLQPQARTIYALGIPSGCTFSCEGTGEGTLTYRWQKNGQDLSNNAFYSGVTTPTLTLTNGDSSCVGDYRCALFATCGTTYTNTAHLTVVSADLDLDGDVDQNDFALLQLCLGATQVQTNYPECVNTDVTNDNRVDDSDLTGLIGCLSGSGMPLSPGC